MCMYGYTPAVSNLLLTCALCMFTQLDRHTGHTFIDTFAYWEARAHVRQHI